MPPDVAKWPTGERRPVNVRDDVPAREPVFDLPASIGVLAAVLIAVHAGRQFVSADANDWLVAALGFSPMRYMGPLGEWPGGWTSAIVTPISHFLLHGDLTHLGINVAMLLAFGGLIARRTSAGRLMVFIALSSAAGALLFYVFNVGTPATMIGASGGISGLVAAGLRVMFSAFDLVPPRHVGDVLRYRTQEIPLQRLGVVLATGRMRVAIGVWLGVNLLAAFGLGSPPDAGTIAWEAHVGGFLMGLFTYALFDEGAKQGRHELATAAAGADQTDDADPDA